MLWNKGEKFALSGKIRKTEKKCYNFLPFIDRVNYKGFGKFQLKSAYKGLGSPLTSVYSEISGECYIAMNICSAKNRKTLASIVELA